MNDFTADDYGLLAAQLREHMNANNSKVFDALLCNSFNVILGALEDAETLKMLGSLKARGYSGEDVAAGMEAMGKSRLNVKERDRA